MAPTDKTERKVRQWVTTMNGDLVTNKDLVELILAVDEDAVDRHREIVVRVETLEATTKDLQNIRDEHVATHGEHMIKYHARRNDDPDGADFTELRHQEDEEMGDIRRVWRVAKWFVAAAVIMALDIFARYLSHSFLGYPS